MALKPPPLKAPPHLLCDWIELRTIATPLGHYRLGSLKRAWDVSRESEDSDPEGFTGRETDTDVEGVSGADEDAFLDAITDEIGDRIQALGDTYPFVLDHGNLLRVVEPSSMGGYVYLFCLLLTYSTGGELFDGSWYPDVTHTTRDLFQACSTVAAAGEVRGCAISFGWPRPNGNPPFLRRLAQVYALFGEGTVVSKPRRGVSPCPKDEEIDVIAWRPRADRAAGTEYLLGQVASGGDWMSKPIHGAPIDTFHRNWFEPPPASPAKGSIFIPRLVEPIDLNGTRRDRMDAITARYGVIVDRLRLPRLMQEGLALSLTDRHNITVERIDDLEKISRWVLVQIRALHQATP